ncbi:MAG: AbrB/MazE/SpoVT family DNA-binding domain-containing protein [Gemmatimonadales bacterium]
MLVSTLTSKYQATVPKAVREALQLRAGDRIAYTLERGGAVRLRKAPAVAEGDLHALETTLAPEWTSADDDAAYADL